MLTSLLKSPPKYSLPFDLHGISNSGVLAPEVLILFTVHHHPVSSEGVVFPYLNCPPLLFHPAGGGSPPADLESALLPRVDIWALCNGQHDGCRGCAGDSLCRKPQPSLVVFFGQFWSWRPSNRFWKVTHRNLKALVDWRVEWF